MSLVDKIKQWLSGSAPAVADSDVLALRSRIAGLELELREQQDKNAALRREAAERDARAGHDAEQRFRDQLVELGTGLAGPLTQVLALEAMVRAGSDIPAPSIVRVALQLLPPLARHGLHPLGTAGQPEPYDPAQHQFAGGSTAAPGSPVLVDQPGFALDNQVLRRAVVRVHSVQSTKSTKSTKN